MIPTLRTLTRKSKFKIGKLRDCTVQKILDLRKPLVLISAYYKYTSINYTEDILEELKIIGKFRIRKPFKNLKLYYTFLAENGYKWERREKGEGADKLMKMSKPLTRGQLQAINHNHF